VFVFRWLQLPVSVAILVLPLELVRQLFVFARFSSLACGQRPGSSRIVPRSLRRECCVAAFHALPSSSAWPERSHSAWRRQHADSAA
jgi:hypothetical protein